MTDIKWRERKMKARNKMDKRGRVKKGCNKFYKSHGSGWYPTGE